MPAGPNTGTARTAAALLELYADYKPAKSSTRQLMRDLITSGLFADHALALDVSDAYVGTGTATSGAPRLFLGTNVKSGDDSAILIGRAVAGDALFSHAIRDESTFTSTGAGAYASYDSAPVMAGAVAYNHFRSFQSRPTYQGAAAIAEVNGFQWQLTHTGLGTIGNAYGVHIVNPGGAGPITTNTAIFIENMTRGVANYAIYSAGTVASYHGGTIEIGATATIRFDQFSGTYGQFLTVDASGFVLGNPNTTLINGVLDLGAAVGDSLLFFHSGNTKYGMDIQASTLRMFTPTGGSILDFGKMSTTDGTTFTSQLTLDGATGNLNIKTGVLQKGGTQVVGARSTGWAAQTAVASKADLGAAPTVGALASWASAIDVALKAHGLIGV